MSRERLPIEALYQAALGIPPSGRSAFIREACGDDEGLRAELEARLEQTAEAPENVHAIHSAAAGLPTEWDGLRLISEIGAGGFGRVYQAHDPTLARDVALKVISLPTNADAATVLHEGQMLARVRHRNVVIVHSAQRVADEVGVTMELVDGQNLDGLIRQHGPMGAEEAAVIGLSVCQALAAVHGAGLVHRDVKAGNVMRERGGRIVLMDFGLGLDVAAASKEATVSGTPPYMAPELFDGYAATPASDLYSLGVLLFFLVTRDYPVPGITVTGILEAHARGERRYLADLRPDLPAAFVRVVEQALAPRPSQRFSTAGSMMRALAEAIPEASHRHARSDPGEQANGSGPDKSTVLRRHTMAWAVGIGGTILGVWILGLITSVAFNVTLRRTEGFSDDTALDWFEFGSRLLVTPLIYAGLTMAALLGAQIVWRLVRRGLSPITSRAEGSIQRVSSVMNLTEPTAAAQWLLVAQGVTLAFFLWSFYDVVTVLSGFPDFVDPSALNILREDSLTPIRYRQTLSIALIIFILSWRALLRRPSAGAIDWGAKAGALMLTVLMLFFLSVPHRLMFLSYRPVVEHSGLRCYDLGRRDMEVLVYCPSWNPPRIRSAASAAVVDTGVGDLVFNGR